MKTPTALLTALLATACGTQQLDPAEIRQAMPRSEALRIDAPDPAVAAPPAVQARVAAAALPAAAPATKAPLAVTSYWMALGVNSGVFWALAPVAFLTELVPPTSCDQSACTWGPGSEAGELNDWRLVVTRSGDGYDYVLSAAPKAPAGSPFVDVMTGHADPGPVQHRGAGRFTVDFDRAWAGMAHAAGEPQKDFGTIAVTYDARGQVSLGVDFRDARNNENPGDPSAPNKVSAAYAFVASGTGGDLQVGFHHQAPYSDAYRDESVTLRTQWNAAGEGRSDVQYLTPGFTAGFNQCWDGAPDYAMTFNGDPAAPVGDLGACRFEAAPITIHVP